METIKIKMGEINPTKVYEALQVLNKRSLSGKSAYKAEKIMDKYSKAFRDFFNHYKEAEIKYAEKDETGAIKKHKDEQGNEVYKVVEGLEEEAKTVFAQIKSKEYDLEVMQIDASEFLTAQISGDEIKYLKTHFLANLNVLE